MEIVLTTAVLPLFCGLVSAVILVTTRTRPYLGYACVCLMCMLIYWQLQGLPKLIPINASQKLFDALLIAAPVFWIFRRCSARTSATIGFVMGMALLAWLLWRRLHLDASIFAFWEIGVPIVIASLVKSIGRDDIAANDQIISLGVFALGLSIVALLAPFVGFAQVAMAFGLFSLAIGGFAFGYAILSGRAPFPDGISDGIQYLTFAIVGTACVVGGFAPDIDRFAYALLPLALAAPPLCGGLLQRPASIHSILVGLVAALPVALAVLLAIRNGN